jgi:magnesium chelatase family protein
LLIRTFGASLVGLDGAPIIVEVEATGRGVPTFHIVGRADRVVQESRDRIRAAFHHSHLHFPSGRVTVNLAPSELPKTGAALDLAIAVGIAATGRQIALERLRRHLLIGELGLDGAVKPVRGTLALASAASALEVAELVVPEANAGEAALCDGVCVRPAAHLRAVLAHLRGEQTIAPAARPTEPPPRPPALDLRDVVGQEGARRALEIAAAGGHHMVLVGPPGSGKTLLASRLVDLLPDLSLGEALEVTRIHSVAGVATAGILHTRPPFRSPHHTISTAGMTGGGRPIRPGELSLAHRGVLFLDEMPELRREVLEALRQPLEEGAIHLARAHAAHTFPARFQLVAAMNPCPCGHYGDPVRDCRCGELLVKRYRARLSGPLLDRIELHVPVPAIAWSRLQGETAPGEDTATVRARVAAARAVRAGWAASGSTAAAEGLAMSRALRREDRAWLHEAMSRLGLSMRAHAGVLRVAKTIACLAGRAAIARADLGEALGYRWLDRELGARIEPRG